MANNLRARAESYQRRINWIWKKQGIKGELKQASRGARYLSLFIRLYNPLQLDTAIKIVESIALATNTPAVIAQRRTDTPGLLTYQFQLATGYWETYTRADVVSQVGAIGLGLAESKRQINFSFDPLLPHTLVAGATRIAGKTETVKSILAGVFETYQPGHLGAIICDPHHDYTDFENVAHLALPIAHKSNEIDAAIAYAGQEMTRRRDRNQRDATPLVVTIDEAETELKDARRFAIVQTLAREAGKFNVYLVIATQKPKQSNMPDLINNLGNRLVGKVTDAATSAMLTGMAGLECHKLTGQGDFIHVGVDVERLQVALATRQDYDRLPRAEIRRPEIELEPEDTPAICNISPEPDKGGRPPLEPDPIAVAHYVYYAGIGKDISIRQAAELLGLSRRAHELNKDFARTVLETIRRLHTARIGA
jgi:hypothetical protein